MLKEIISRKLANKFPAAVFDVAIPPDSKMGDYSTNAAFSLAKNEGKNPIAVAEELASDFKNDEEFAHVFEKIEVAKPGFINFFLKKEFLHKKLEDIYSKINDFGNSNIGQGKKIIVEYSSPNIAKQMHIGSLRSTIIGDALANIYETLGYKVIRWNYVGDWGTQFGKLIKAYKLWGNEAELEQNPISEMQRLYVKFHEEIKNNLELEKEGQEEFRKLEEGDKDNRKIWKHFRNLSLEEFRRMYDELGLDSGKQKIKGESDYESKLKPMIKELKKQGFVKESEGALIAELDGLPPMLLRKSDGATLYATRDMASLKERIEEYKNLEKILYVVANQQALYFEQLFSLAEKLGWTKTKLVHVKFGMVLGEDGKKLATREGKVIPLQDVIDKITALSLETVKEKNPSILLDEANNIARVVGVGALKYNDLKQHPHTDIMFDWKAMLDISGNSGPYIQYAYARLSNILEKSGNSHKADASLLVEPEEEKLMKKILEFPDSILKCAEHNTLNGLALYLYELANCVNNFYEKIHVASDENKNRRNARLMLVETVAPILKKGLGILGIKSLERI